MAIILLKLLVALVGAILLGAFVFFMQSHAEAQLKSEEEEAAPPRVTLKNGLRLANFSSPHHFVFDDGSVLGPVTEDVMELGKLDSQEVEEPYYISPQIDIVLKFSMSETCEAALKQWYDAWRLHKIDVVIVPFPVLQLLRHSPPRWMTGRVNSSPFRTIRCVDRATKVNSATKFCV